METNCIFVSSNFVIYPQILLFLVSNIASFTHFPYWLQIKFFMTLFFYLITFTISLWHGKFVTADVTAVFSTINMVFSDKEKDFDKNT